MSEALPDIITSTKTFKDFPCAHRQYKHKGNCALIHGYSRSFHFVFGCVQQDACGFVVDFGDLKWLSAWLSQQFDHTLLIDKEDPFLSIFQDLHMKGACNLRTPPHGVGMEGSAQWCCEYADHELRARTRGRAWVVSVEARENEKNSAIWINPNAGFKGWT